MLFLKRYSSNKKRRGGEFDSPQPFKDYEIRGTRPSTRALTSLSTFQQELKPSIATHPTTSAHFDFYLIRHRAAKLDTYLSVTRYIILTLSTMSVVSLLNVNVKNNPAPFGAPYEFEITFECLEPLQRGEVCSEFS